MRSVESTGVVTLDVLFPVLIAVDSLGSLMVAVLVTLGAALVVPSVFTTTVRLLASVAPAAMTVEFVQVTRLPPTVLTEPAPVQVQPVPEGAVLMMMPLGSGSSIV